MKLEKIYITALFSPIVIIIILIMLDLIYGYVIEVAIDIKIPISIFTPIETHDYIDGDFATDGYLYNVLYLSENQTKKITKKIEKIMIGEMIN